MKVKDEQWNERIPEERKRCSEALSVFNEKRFEASLVCSRIVTLALDKPASLMRAYMINFAKGDLRKANDLIPRLGDAVNLAVDFMRKELGYTPLSSESAESPSVDSLKRFLPGNPLDLI